MADPRREEFDRELAALEAELKRLEIEFTQFFTGRRQRPPFETRSRVQSMVKRLDRLPLSNYGDRFRFSTLQSKVTKSLELWERGLRAKEEGRPGPFTMPHADGSRRAGDDTDS